MQTDGIQRLEIMNRDLADGNNLIEDTNKELLRQQDKLLIANEHNKDMLSVMSKKPLF